MVSLYSGTPGSGKSYHAACKIIEWLMQGYDVIANFPINMGYFSRRAEKGGKLGRFYCIENSDITPAFLRSFSLSHYEPGTKPACMVVIDECGVLFNPRNWQNCDRMGWIDFLANHRKYRLEIVLISQTDMMIDKQIRPLIEKEYRHRNIRNHRFFGLLLHLLTGGLFVSLEFWYGPKLKNSTEFIHLNKRKANIYNTLKFFDANPADPQEEPIDFDRYVILPPVRLCKRKKAKKGKRGRGRRNGALKRAQGATHAARRGA